MNLQNNITWNDWNKITPTIESDNIISERFLGIIRYRKAPNDNMLCSPEIYYLDKHGVIWCREHKPMSHKFEMIYWIYLDDLFDWK